MIEVQQAAALPGHQHPIYTVCNSRKEHIIFTGGGEASVVEWSLKTLLPIKILFKTKGSIYALHSPEELNLLVSGDRTGAIFAFDFEKQEIVKELNHHKKAIFDIQSYGHDLYTASEDGSICQWSLDNWEKKAEVQLGADTIRALAVSPNGRYLAAGCRDSSIVILLAEDLSICHRLEGHTMAVFSLAFSPDGQFLLSGSRDAQLMVWSVPVFNLYKQIPAHLFAINSIAWHPEENLFTSASMDKSIKIWDGETFQLRKIIDLSKSTGGHRLSVNKICWNRYANQLVSVSDDKMVMVWDVKAGDQSV